jgi:hypothetical protein
VEERVLNTVGSLADFFFILLMGMQIVLLLSSKIYLVLTGIYELLVSFDDFNFFSGFRTLFVGAWLSMGTFPITNKSV